MENILKDIEKKYNVQKILVNREQIWPFLRMKYFFTYIEMLSDKPELEKLRKTSFIQKIKLTTNVFYGWKKWFKKYDYIALSTSRPGIKKKIKDKFYDRLIDPIIDELGSNRCLYIEMPYTSHYPKKQNHTHNIVSYFLVLFLAFIIEKMTLFPPVIKGMSILNSIQKEYNLNIPNKKLVIYYRAKYKIFSFIFRIIKPKAIFIVCYYSNFAAIKAANDLGILTIEIQHGIIGYNHPAYNIHIDVDKSYFPDYLLVFGKRDLLPFATSKFINQNNLYPIGSFYIEFIQKNFIRDNKLLNIISKYKKCVGITLQRTVEQKTIEFISKAAIMDDSICYILIPRQPVQTDYSALKLPKNVMVIVNKDFYELMAYVDFHSTVNSTCALEAPSLGVQNIMINIQDLSKNYYELILNNKNITRYVNTSNEYVKIINNFTKIDKKTIQESNDDIIKSHYTENIKKVLNKLNLI